MNSCRKARTITFTLLQLQHQNINTKTLYIVCELAHACLKLDCKSTPVCMCMQCMWFFVCLTVCWLSVCVCVCKEHEKCVREDGKEAGHQDVESIVCPTMKRSSRQESCASLNGGINIWGQRAGVCVCMCVSLLWLPWIKLDFQGFFSPPDSE